MSKFKPYNIDLRNIGSNVQVFEYNLDDEYFAKIDSEEVSKGNVKAVVRASKRISTYELEFELEGQIKIPCDRCLDDMEQSIKHAETIAVKLGADYAEEENVVIVPESDSSINIAWFLYEFIILNIPIKHIHPAGECNKTMLDQLKFHLTKRKDVHEDVELLDEEEEDDDFDDEATVDNSQIDPRWADLQNIKFENN